MSAAAGAAPSPAFAQRAGREPEAPFASAAEFVAAGTSWATRALVLGIAALLVAILVWAAWATVDELVQASGRAEPQGQVRLVNHPRGGRVGQLEVREGDRVAAGDLLLRFDARVTEAELAETLGRWQVKAIEAARLESEAHDLPLRLPSALGGARPDLVDAQLRLRQARKETLATRRLALAQAVDGRRAALATVSAERARVGDGLVHLDQQLAAMRELSERGLYPRLRLMAAEKQRSDARGELRKAEAELAAASAALAEAKSRLEGFEREQRSLLLDEQGVAAAERDRLAEQLAGQQALTDGLELKAPVAGTVLDLAVAAVGQSVAANAPILRLVPEGETVAVEARVLNEDIGRVRLGMPAVIKVRAFDYLRHGTLEGSVTRIAADATPEPGIAAAGRLSYVVTVATDRQQLGTSTGDRALVPGMLVDVELKAGSRTILSYLTDRLFKLQDAAFTEG